MRLGHREIWELKEFDLIMETDGQNDLDDVERTMNETQI